jgi:6-phosphogluconate dehydrogenase
VKLGFVGLGRMGANMVHRLLDGDHEVVVWNRSKEPIEQAVSRGAVAARNPKDLVKKLAAPRTVWLMLPAGKPTDDLIDLLLPVLDKGDVIVDGGNSHFQVTKERAARALSHGVHFVDCGTSGGIWGYANGYCLMVGGHKRAVKQVEPAFITLAPPDGYAHVGPVASGHFVKMVHNGIEYGMMQAIGEGFEVLEKSDLTDFDLGAIAKLWQHSSVVRSWLIELAALAFAEDPELASIDDYTSDSGEARWTVLEAMDKDIPTPVITLSLLARFSSRQEESFALKVVSALRNQFGGHAVKPSG